MNLDRRLLRLAYESRNALVLTIAFGFLVSVLSILQAGALSRIINQTFLEKQPLPEIAGLLIILLGAIFTRAIFIWGNEVAANEIASRVKSNLRQRLLQRVWELGPVYSREEKVGEITNLALEGVEALDAYFSQYLPGLVLALLAPLTILVFVFPVDWLSAVILLVTAPLIPFFMSLIGNLAQTLTRKRWQALAQMGAYFLDMLQGLTTLKMLGRSKEKILQIAKVSENFRQATMSVLQTTFLSALVLEMVATISTAVIAVQVGLRLLYGYIPFEKALFVLILAPEFYLPLRLLGTRFHAGMSGVAASKRIFEVLDVPDADERKLQQIAPSSAKVLLPANPPVMPDIQFRDVEFSYPGDRQVLKGVSFHLQAGSKVALVGPSGGGKTTIANLLLRFISPQWGQIMVNGVPLEHVPISDWRSHVSWVPQNPYLFNNTVAANIRIADHEASMERVVWAAKQAHAHEFIEGLPQGYDTPIGERGTRLSGGQAQRIALARAFLKDAPLIVLDEPTAHLDPEVEALIHDALNHLLQNRTALIIAHHLQTVMDADQVIVLEEGRIVEAGTHEQLIKRGGLYQRLIHAALADLAIKGDLEKRPESSLKSPPQTIPSVLPRSAEVPSLPDELTSPISLRPLWFLLRMVRPFIGMIILSVLAGFATISSNIGLMGTSAYIISAAALRPSIADLQVAIVGVRFFGIARGLFRYAERYISHQVTFRLLARLRTWFYQALEPLAPARIMGLHSGDLLARIMGDIESLENFYVRALAPPLVAVSVAITANLFLSNFEAHLGVVLLCFLLLAGLFVPLVIRLVSRKPSQKIVITWSALNVAWVDSFLGLADLTAFGQGERQTKQVNQISRNLISNQRRMAIISGLQSAWVSLLTWLCVWLILISAIEQVDQIGGVYLAVLALVALTSFEAISPLPLAAQHLERNLRAAQRLSEVVNAQPEVRDPEPPQPLPKRTDLSFVHLSFRYPSASVPDRRSERPWVLKDIHFTLPQGKRLGIVGPSGAGKTTLVNLLLRFWDYGPEGHILLGGEDIRLLDSNTLRQSIGVVSQNTYLFSTSIRNNLLIARPEATQDEIASAVERAQLRDFILSLPEGYETWVGDQGLRLSAGERQRLGIARALLKDAPLLILDEPTANLDALTERQILTAIFELMQGRTTLLLTHRLVGLEAMDEILVLDRGQIVERGRETDLLLERGLYRRMWELQNRLLLE